MTEADIQCLQNHIDGLVEIRTIDDECLIAKILIVTPNDEYDEHDVLYELVSSNQADQHTRLGSAGEFVLDFDKIASLKPCRGSR
jgi:hypothetical protein